MEYKVFGLFLRKNYPPFGGIYLGYSDLIKLSFLSQWMDFDAWGKDQEDNLTMEYLWLGYIKNYPIIFTM